MAGSSEANLTIEAVAKLATPAKAEESSKFAMHRSAEVALGNLTECKDGIRHKLTSNFWVVQILLGHAQDRVQGSLCEHRCRRHTSTGGDHRDEAGAQEMVGGNVGNSRFVAINPPIRFRPITAISRRYTAPQSNYGL